MTSRRNPERGLGRTPDSDHPALSIIGIARETRPSGDEVPADVARDHDEALAVMEIASWSSSSTGDPGDSAGEKDD